MPVVEQETGNVKDNDFGNDFKDFGTKKAYEGDWGTNSFNSNPED